MCYYISTPMRVHWCVLLYINTNESTSVGTISFLCMFCLHFVVVCVVQCREMMYIN